MNAKLTFVLAGAIALTTFGTSAFAQYHPRYKGYGSNAPSQYYPRYKPYRTTAPSRYNPSFNDAPAQYNSRLNRSGTGAPTRRIGRFKEFDQSGKTIFDDGRLDGLGCVKGREAFFDPNTGGLVVRPSMKCNFPVSQF